MRKFFLIPLLALAAAAPPASASDPFATHHVAESGSDSNPGTEARPFRTITKALKVSSAYELVLVNPGIYPRVDDSTARNFGPVTVRGLGNREARIAGAMIAGARSLRFENLSIEGEFQVRKAPTGTRISAGIQVLDSRFTREGSKGLCMSIRDGSEWVLVQGNVFESCGYGIAGPGTAIRDPNLIKSARHITIRNNVMRGFVGDAIQFASWDDVTIDGNEISNLHDPASLEHNDGIQVMGNSDRVRITNNRISDSGGQLIFAQDAIAGGNSDLLIRNNLVNDADSWGIFVQGTHGNRVINNTAWDGNHADIMLGKDSSNLGPANHVAVNNIAGNLSARDWGVIAERDYNIVQKSNMGAYPHDIVGVNPVGDLVLGLALGSGDPKYSVNRGYSADANGLAGEPAAVLPITVPPPPGYTLPSWLEPTASAATALRKGKSPKRPKKRARVRWASR